MTNGVTMPSFRPLSTFSARRILTGTARFVKIASPSAASVGAKIEAVSAAAAHPAPGNRSAANTVPNAIVERETDQEEPTGEMGIALDLLEPDGRSVREQHHRERQLHTQQDGLARK